MKQVPGFDCLSFDPFSLFQDGLVTAQVDVGRAEVLQALVVASIVVVLDKGVDLLPEIARQVVVLQQDAVLQGLVQSLDHALGLRVIRCASDMIHLPVFQPVGQFARDVARPVIAEQPWFVQDLCWVTTRSLQRHVSVTSPDFIVVQSFHAMM